MQGPDWVPKSRPKVKANSIPKCGSSCWVVVKHFPLNNIEIMKTFGINSILDKEIKSKMNLKRYNNLHTFNK